MLPPVKWDLFKLGGKIKKEIKEKYLPDIEKNPESKLNELTWENIKLYSYHFSIGKFNYRIMYKIYKSKVYILQIGVRKVFSSEGKEFFAELGKRLTLMGKSYE